MSSRRLVISAALVKSALYALGVLVSLGLQAVRAEAPAPAGESAQHEHGSEHGHHDHDAHQHHAAGAPGATRLVASYTVPEVTLTDQKGQAVSLRAVVDADRPVMLNFFFTSCTAICPVMTATLAKAQRELGADSDKIRMVSISIDPEHDTPAVLAEYATRFDAGPQWHFLTGRLEDSIAVQRAFEAYRGDKMDHTPATFLRAAPGRPWVRIDGFATSDELAREFHELVAAR